MDRMLLRPAEVAEALGICRTKTYDLIATGAIPSVRIGASVRVPADSLRAWIAAQTDQTAKAALDSRLSR
jgi:prophage regulatory protein